LEIQLAQTVCQRPAEANLFRYISDTWVKPIVQSQRAANPTEQSMNNSLPTTEHHDDPARAKALKNHRDDIVNDAC
jgi:hypothetical protein